MNIKIAVIVFALPFFFGIQNAWALPANDYVVLKETNDLSTVLKLVDRLQLDKWLTENKATVFAPTDAAFKNFPKKLMEALSPEKSEQRLKLLQHHVAGGAYETLKDKQVITLLDGGKLKVSVKGDKTYVNNVLLRQTILTGQGVVYIVDKLLKSPPK